MQWLIVYLGSLVYLCGLVPFATMGAADKNMLSVFNIDEFLVYNVVDTMLKADLRHFLDPIQQVYGYLYHFLNAVALMLTRPINGLVGLSPARFDVLVLRELTAIYYLAAVILFLRTIFAEAPAWSVVFAWIALITLPVTFSASNLLHPDNLAFLLMVGSLVLLVRDRNKFGRKFWIAASVWGLAINTKMYGIFLFPMFAFYCGRSAFLGEATWRASAFRLGFAGLVAVVIFLLTMPFLIFGDNLRDFVRALFSYSATYVTGTRNVVSEPTPLVWYRTVIERFYFHWSFLICIAVGLVCLARSSGRDCALLLVAFLPMLLHFVLNVSWAWFWYLIPTLVPLVACAFFVPTKLSLRSWQLWLFLAVSPIAIWQIWHNSNVTLAAAQARLQSEATDPSISLYRKVESLLGSRSTKVRSVFRDPFAYVPDTDGVRVSMKWGLATYDNLIVERGSNEGLVDLVVLQKEYIGRCSSEDSLRRYMDYMKQSFEENRPCISFYSDAAAHKLKGFVFLTETDFGVAFIRQGL
ncbi:hypothetical protein LRC39_20750 [Rhodopseudomonas sp. P1]|uniref:hypothetical protein n=1 Tax=Rhodopseudomonas sp. P1 TaxID=3434357 RepID=UPI0031FC12A6